MRPSMPCREFKVDKRSRGPVFGEYVHLKGRTSLHKRYMRHLLPLILPLKGKNKSPHARYAPPSPFDLGGNYPLST